MESNFFNSQYPLNFNLTKYTLYINHSDQKSLVWSQEHLNSNTQQKSSNDISTQIFEGIEISLYYMSFSFYPTQMTLLQLKTVSMFFKSLGGKILY